MFPTLMTTVEGNAEMDNHTYSVQVLMKKGKRGAASYIHNECLNQVNSRHLSEILDILLNPNKTIDEWETIDWLKWLIAGGKTPDEYSALVRKYDNATTCGLVWIANYVAYRCRTCGISPCMSLCSECFKRADHTGHDFNMFRSQAGGACDCGDTSVMKVSGFCDRHGPNAQVTKLMPPQDLMCVAEGVMPRVILRLIQHLRENSKSGSSEMHLMTAFVHADDFITMFHDFCNMGAAMRHVMTSALTNPQVYKNMLNGIANEETEFAQYLAESQRIYQDALRSLPNPEPPPEFRHCQALQEFLVHNTFLDELVFWTVKFEFPQKIVTLLLNMLPDPEYKEALTQAFVLHYSRIAMMLERSTDPDTLSNRVVHVSVQLFSNEALAYRMTEEYYLLHIMVISLKFMMSKILIPNTLHNPERNFHFNVDCGQQVMKEHCYWPLVSDLNNVLSHRPIAIKFMRDDSLLEMWFSFLAMFQGMNVNQRELVQHIEFEPTTYYAAFSAELEASAYPMWALVSHISDESTVQLNIRVINECLTALQDWFDAINLFTGNVNLPDNHQVSFHIPLHRYLSVFMCQAVNSQGVSLQQVLPPLDMLHLIMLHPLRIQVAFYEIINGLWVRNGLQIKGQAMTYIQCNFCNSMVDADLYLLQVCATQLPTDTFMQTVIDKFHMSQWLTFSPSSQSTNTNNDTTDYDTPMFESFLTFLATLVSIRTNLGINQGQLTELELVTLLCMGDKTHSALMELMPERCGSTQNRDFDSVLNEVADYRAPNYEMSGNMVQGMYVPKDRVWENLYSPIHVLLRAVHRRDFQTSMDRYTEYISGAGRIKSGNPPWPPLRAPGPAHPAYGDPRRVLGTRLFHSVVWIGLYKAVHFHSVSEHVMSLIVFLLEMTVDFTLRDSTQQYSGQVCSSTRTERRDVKDLDLAGWFDTDWLSENLRTVIGSITLNPEPNVTFDDSDSEEDGWRVPGSNLWSQQGSLVFDPLAPESSPALLNLSLRPLGERGVAEDGGGASETALANTNEENAMEVSLAPALTEQNSSGPSSSSSIVQSSSTTSTTTVPGSSSTSSSSNPQPLAVMAGTEMVPSSPYPRPEVRTPGPPLPLTGSSSAGVDVVPRLTTSTAGVNGNGIPRLQGSNDVIPRLPHHHHKVMPYMGKRRNQPNSANFTSIGNDQTIEANESIISLLLRLHSHLSGTPDSFTPDPADVHNESRVGDGAFFVAKVLNRIMALDELCRQSVLSTREKLWPRQPEETDAERKGREERERNERRRRAKERQNKLMKEFADKQKQFMEKAMANKDEEMEWDEDETSQKETSKKEYDCVICNQTSPSTNEKPMGLVVLMQATSVLGHKRRTSRPVQLPTSDEERQNLRRDETLACEFDKRIEELDRNFDRFSWLVSVNLGWEGGVHVQTCGHHLHLDCLTSYLNSLRGQQSTREYTCPLCRQLANSVLPLPPHLGETASLIPSKEADMSAIINSLSKLLIENIEENIRRARKEEENKESEQTNLMYAMTKAMQGVKKRREKDLQGVKKAIQGTGSSNKISN
uniref:E3 ubiquitin-protein ligase n=1 Tax=Cacopsylla melanoneura TaxID=428564 RepID=A0A8D8RJ41_9HEMI